MAAALSRAASNADRHGCACTQQSRRWASETTRPDEMWHIDTTVIRLLDGTRAYLHAVIDNFSRRILAWRVAETFAPGNSVAVLGEASRGATPSETTHSLDSVTTVRRLVEFYVQEHNRVLPHSAFRGQTPDEMYFGTGDAVPADLTSRAAAARRARVEANRSAACGTCSAIHAAA
jgi:putative transposase